METRTSKKRKRPNSLMTDSGETKTDSLIRAASLSCDSRRIGLVSTQIASNDTVLILNDQTGQSVVVASNQSTRDALASLVQRDSEAEKKDIVSRMATDEIEMRRVMEEQALKFFAEEDARRNVWSPPIRARPQSQQPRKRSSCKSEPFVDPLTISTKEAQTMFLNYLNFAQPEFAKLNYCLAAPNFVKDQSFPVEGSTNPSSILSVSQECVTATAIVVDTSNSVIPPLQELGLSSIPAKASPKKDSRAFFGISRFLEEESTETIELASVSPTKPKKTCVMSKSATNAKKSVNKVSNSPTEKEERPRSVNPKKVTKKTSTAVKEETVTLSGAVNTNDAAAPSVSRETQFPVTKDIPTAVSASNISLQEQQETIRQPLKVEPDDPERSRLFLWAPGTRSNRGRSDSPSHYKTDAELIEFLRKPLEKAREEERQAAQRKLLDPLPKRKPRIKSSAAPASNSNQGMPTEQKFSEQMGDTSCDMASHDYSQFLSTPSDMLLEQQEMESFLQSFDIPNFER
uniref:Uncharacterized protein n=2 Tax=Caenorhabditis japonica TaxID=281687 RepID=A0A8R1EV13_CAEJA